MNKRNLFKLVVVLAAISVLLSTASGFAQSPAPGAVERLQQAALGKVELTWNPATGTPSFVRGQIPAAALPGSRSSSASGTTMAPGVAMAFFEAYADLFGMAQPAQELRLQQDQTDSLGFQHLTFSQVSAGIPVYGAVVKVHLSAGSHDILAVGNGFIPGIHLADARPQITADQASAVALRALPGGTLTAAPSLVVFAGLAPVDGSSARLAWMVEARDDTLPARNLYAVDAINGRFLDVIDRLYVSRDRKTYDAGHGTGLPGTLRRSEATPPVGDADVDNAHQFAGDTYDYYWGTFGRDSYDGLGATLISTAHYGTNYQNAFWNGSQMVYGDGFPVNDVAAHELTHAVTERTANLTYSWQSGALNESISDIFGAMVDRDDWLMGEDMPIGAIRDLSNPTAYGQPDHTSNWVSTCSDNQGVHTNSGITNKAYYNIATAITKDKAEQIFYRTLTVYLQSSSSLEDARAAALQSATDIYGAGSAEYNAVNTGFNDVGLDGNWNPPTNSCTCAVASVLAGAPEELDPAQIASTLYRVRDELLTANPDVLRYRQLYEQYTGRISIYLLLSPDLRAQAVQILKDVTPGLSLLLDGQGQSSAVTSGTVTEITGFLSQLAALDQSRGDGELAQVIAQEMARWDWQRLAGMTYTQAWVYIQAHLGSARLYLPALVR